MGDKPYEINVLSPDESIRVKTAIADEWRKVLAQESRPSTPIRAGYLPQYLTDLAVITGLLIEAISRLDALTTKLTPEGTSDPAPVPISAKDSTDVSPAVWKATGTP